MASAICQYLDWRSRSFYLFDTFRPTTPDSAGIQSLTGSVNRFYATESRAVADNFDEWPGVELVVGTIPATLNQRSIDQVAFIHIDLNHPAAEEAAVRHFWPRIVTGGIMIFDDYGFQGFEAQRESADRLGRELGFSVLTSPTGQGVVVKAGTESSGV
jgi:Methyltransferase domain